MKKAGWSAEWMLGACAGIFFLMGKYFAPYYENLSNAATGEEGSGISDGVLLVSIVFAGFLVMRLVYRFKRR